MSARITAAVLLALTMASSLRAAPGGLDPSYGSGGVATLPGTRALDAVLQPDGKMVLLGNDGAFLLARFTADGSADGAFGVGGIVSTDYSTSYEDMQALAVQPDGRIIAVGSRPTVPPFGTPRELLVARFDPAGALDPTFGTGGVTTTLVSTFADDGNAVTVQPDGKIVVAGRAISNSVTQGLVVRYEPDGTLDPTFGTGGVAVVGIDLWAVSVIVQADGKIVAAGSGFIPALSVEGWILARFDTNGVPDPTFGTGGLVEFAVGASGAAKVVRQQGDGRLVVAGQGLADGGIYSNVALVRLESDGTFDPSFGTGGEVMTDVTPADNDGSEGMTIDPAGRILVVAIDEAGPDGRFTILRYRADGTLDPGFGTGGIVFTPISGGYAFPRGVGVQGDGRIVVGGAVGPGGAFAAARYFGAECGDGVLDPGEGCDDGNTAPGDCCSPTCVPDPPGAICADDGHDCTFDVCNAAGTCVHPAKVESTCKHVTRPRAAKLVLKDRTPDTGDLLVWKWRMGEATTLGDLLDPFVTNSFTLCLFDESTPTPHVLLESTAPAGGICGRRPCWNGLSKGSGFRYRDPAATPEGAATGAFKSGGTGHASMAFKGAGALLGLPSLPLTLPARVQLQTRNGTCWEAEFTAAEAARNDAAQFSGSGE